MGGGQVERGERGRFLGRGRLDSVEGSSKIRHGFRLESLRSSQGFSFLRQAFPGAALRALLSRQVELIELGLFRCAIFWCLFRFKELVAGHAAGAENWLSIYLSFVSFLATLTILSREVEWRQIESLRLGHLLVFLAVTVAGSCRSKTVLTLHSALVDSSRSELSILHLFKLFMIFAEGFTA